jgi:hypothetical protein
VKNDFCNSAASSCFGHSRASLRRCDVKSRSKNTALLLAYAVGFEFSCCVLPAVLRQIAREALDWRDN